jgi:hypothetical protein
MHMVNKGLDGCYLGAQREDNKGAMHELACAGVINLTAYLGWERSNAIFATVPGAIVVTPPADGAARNLPPGVGAVEHTLLAETKSDPTLVADVVIAYTTLSGLSLSTWLERLQGFNPQDPALLFSTARTPTWTSRHFRTTFAIPIFPGHFFLHPWLWAGFNY